MNSFRIKIVQVNLDRSVKVSAELVEAMVGKRIDVALVQEPYARNGNVCGLGSGRVIYVRNENVRPWACIVVNNDRLGAGQRNDLSSSHCVCVELLLPEGRKMFIYSAYCQPTIEIEFCLEWMEAIVKLLGGY